MIAIVALVIRVLMALITPAHADVIVIPPMPKHSPNLPPIPFAIDDEEREWSEYYADAYAEYADEFTALFNSYSYRVSKNGRSMINGKFVKMGA
jgi:hypothetical protein